MEGCGICKEDVDSNVIIKCNTCSLECCKPCLEKWVKRSWACPQCRTNESFDGVEYVEVEEEYEITPVIRDRVNERRSIMALAIEHSFAHSDAGRARFREETERVHSAIMTSIFLDVFGILMSRPEPGEEMVVLAGASPVLIQHRMGRTESLARELAAEMTNNQSSSPPSLLIKDKDPDPYDHRDKKQLTRRLNKKNKYKKNKPIKNKYKNNKY